MILNIIVVLSFCLQLNNALVFDCYTGKIASKELIAYYKSKGILDVCTTKIKPCCATERRRVDGSCNCLHSPTKGTYFVPLTRVLPALYYNGSYPRKAESGKDLLWPRIIRRVLLAEGKTSDCHFTQAMTSYGVFMFADFASVHDVLNYLTNTTNCCTKQGEKNYMCTPNYVSNEDSLNRLGHVTCLNLTRPLTYQDFGCTNDSIPSPIVQATSTFDLSQIYNFRNLGEKAIRTYHGGLVIMEVENGKTWPQTGPASSCPLNKPDETRCFVNNPNVLVTQELFIVWFMRLHNYFATQLAIVNPCWDDDELFYVARDMNIACAMQMYLYEWLASLEGRDNLEESGVISKKPGFRKIHDPTKCPSITLEFIFANRWFHLAQDTTAKLYDKHGHYLRDFPMFNLTTRTGFLVKYKRMEEFTQSQFRQPSGKINDRTIDHEVADNGLPGGLQYAVDITASDLNKNRLFGLRPYIDYVHYCTGHKITCFDDLRRHIHPCKIKELMKVYEDVRDVELMAGMWCEKQLIGGWIPRTLACLLNDNLLKAIKGDRHWYENEHRPYPFTKRQLLEIRKASLAWLLCTVGDGVTKVQRHAFLTISPKNPLLKCSQIPGINFEAWADHTCSCDDATMPPCKCHDYEL